MTQLRELEEAELMLLAMRILLLEIIVIACFTKIEVLAFQAAEKNSPDWITLALVADSVVVEHLVFDYVFNSVKEFLEEALSGLLLL